MGKLRKYNDKRPRPNGVAPREHYVRKNGVWKAKMIFPNMASADNYIESRAFFRENGYVGYICSYCGKIHIGRLNERKNSL